jgi:hypothetical protein
MNRREFACGFPAASRESGHCEQGKEMKRRAKKLSRKSFDQVLRERVLALSDRVREDDRKLAALARRREQRIRKRLFGSN